MGARSLRASNAALNHVLPTQVCTPLSALPSTQSCVIDELHLLVVCPPIADVQRQAVQISNQGRRDIT